MRFVNTILVLAVLVALMVPAQSSAKVKVKTVRKMSKVYNRAKRDLSSISTVRSATDITKDGETFAPKPPTPSTTAPSKAPVVEVVATEAPTKIPTVLPTTSPTKYMVKVPISMKLVLNGICECSPEVTEYLTSYVVDAFEGRFLGVSLMANSSDTECVGSCDARQRNLIKKNQLRFLADDDKKLELSIEGYQVVRPGDEKNLIDSVLGNTAMNNALASQIKWLAKDSGLPISSGSITVMVEVLPTASPSFSPSVSPPLPTIDRNTSKITTGEAKSSSDTTGTVVLSVAFTLIGGLLLAGYANGRRSAESPRADGGNVIVRDVDEENFADVDIDKAANVDVVGSDPADEVDKEGFDPVTFTSLDIENPVDIPGNEEKEEENEENSVQRDDSERDVADGEEILTEKEVAEEEDVPAVENVSPDESVPPADDEISNQSTGPEGEEEEEEVVDENTGVSSQVVVEVDESIEVTPAVAVTDEVDDRLEEENEMVTSDNSSTPFIEKDLEEGTDITRNSNNMNDGTVTSPSAIDGDEVGVISGDENKDDDEATSSLLDEVGEGNDNDGSSKVQESINDVSIDSVESA